MVVVFGHSEFNCMNENNAFKSWNLGGAAGLVGRSYMTPPAPWPEQVYYVTDHLGSIRAVVDVGGYVREARDYYPYGLTMPGRFYAPVDTTREGFTGHELDKETGQYYAGARFYSPALGRWFVVDPLAEKYPALSPYSYVANNPLIFIDPNGEEIRICDQNFMDEGETGECITYTVGMEYKGENQFISSVVNQLNWLSDIDNDLHDFINFLANTEDTHTITYTRADPITGSNEGSRDSRIGYDPRRLIKDETGRDIHPVIALIHELSHSLDAQFQARDNTYTGRNPRTSVRRSEVRAVQLENIVRRHLMQEERVTYNRTPTVFLFWGGRPIPIPETEAAAQRQVIQLRLNIIRGQ